MIPSKAMRAIFDPTLDEQGAQGMSYSRVIPTLFAAAMLAAPSLGRAESKLVVAECKTSGERFWLRVQDQGPGFKLEHVPDCTADENLQCCGGRGLALIKAYMTRVDYNECGNCVTMEKHRAAAETG